MHAQNIRTWIPFLGIGFVLGAVLLVGIWGTDWSGGQAQTPQDASETQKAPTLLSYRAQILDMLSMVQIWSADELYGILLSLRVPSEERVFHLALVQAIAHLRAGEVQEGNAELAQLKADYPWLAQPLLVP